MGMVVLEEHLLHHHHHKELVVEVVQVETLHQHLHILIKIKEVVLDIKFLAHSFQQVVRVILQI